MTSWAKTSLESWNHELVALWTLENRKNVLLKKTFIDLKNRYAFLSLQPYPRDPAHREML